MKISRSMTRRAIAVLGTSLVAGLAGGPPAQATDASLRKAVVQQEKKVDVVADDFAKAGDDTFSAVGREQAETALTELKTAVRHQKKVVAKQQATTTKVKRARVRYLTAVDSVSAGLKTFGQGLDAFDPDAPSKSKELIKKASAQLKSAMIKRERARKLIVPR